MDTLVAKLEALLGADAILTGEAAKERGFSLWTRVGAPRAVARPRTTEEVAGVLKLARAEGVAVVPWGGLTGLVSGTAAEGALALSMERLNAIEEIDPLQGTMTVQTGCVLAKRLRGGGGEGPLPAARPRRARLGDHRRGDLDQRRRQSRAALRHDARHGAGAGGGAGRRDRGQRAEPPDQEQHRL